MQVLEFSFVQDHPDTDAGTLSFIVRAKAVNCTFILHGRCKAIRQWDIKNRRSYVKIESSDDLPIGYRHSSICNVLNSWGKDVWPIAEG